MIPRPGTGGAPARPAAYVYLLRSRKDGTYYVGWTTDPVRRLVEHNARLSTYTNRKLPWQLIGVEPQATVEVAKAYERSLKRSPRNLARFKKRVLNRAAIGRLCQGVG
jgi:putative endonuclease